MHLSNCREVAYLLDFSDEEAESIIHYNENDLGLLFDQNPTTLHWEPGAVVAALISKLPALRQLSIDFFFSPTYIDLMVRYALTDRTLPSGRKLFSSLTKVRISQARDHLPYNFLFGTVNRSPTHHQLPDLPRYFQSFPSLKSLHANHLIEWQRSTVLPRPQSYRSAVETIELLSCSRDYDFEEMEDLISSCRRLKEFSFSGGIGDIDRQLPLYIHIRRCLLKSHRETLELLSLSDNRGTSRTPLQGEPVAFLQLEVLKELVIPWRIVVGIWARHEYYDLTAAEWEAREEPMTKHLRAAFPTSLKRLYLEGCEDFWYSNCLDKVLRDKARLLPQLASLVLSHIADTGLERAMATAEVAEQVGLKVQLVAYGHTMDRDMGFPQTRKVLTEPYYTEVV